jgi:hypothetical protein
MAGGIARQPTARLVYRTSPRVDHGVVSGAIARQAFNIALADSMHLVFFVAFFLQHIDGRAVHPASPSGFSQDSQKLLALDGFLDVFLQIAILRLDCAADMLGFSFLFQFLITDDFAGDLLDFAFRLFDAAFDLIFVHDALSPDDEN